MTPYAAAPRQPVAPMSDAQAITRAPRPSRPRGAADDGTSQWCSGSAAWQNGQAHASVNT